MQDKAITGDIRIRGFVTFTVDEAKSKEFGKIIRYTGKEKIMTADDLRQAVEDKKNPIHKYGFGVLYAFNGTVNDRFVSFDTATQAEIKTLGYARAALRDDVAYIHMSFNENPDYNRPSCLFGHTDYQHPDVLGAFRVNKIDEGDKIKFRQWKDGDEKHFPLEIMRTVTYEPGSLARSAHIFMPDGFRAKAGKGLKKRGRKPKDPNKIVDAPLPNKEVLSRLDFWLESKSSKLCGFKLHKQSERSRILVIEFEEGCGYVKLAASTRRIELSYMGDEGFELRKEWLSAPTIDADEIKSDVLNELHVLLKAYV